jgi:hypothetical protein
MIDLPDYFLADLPPQATLSPAMLEEACRTLKRNRLQYLAGRPTRHVLETICQVAENWRTPDDPFRELALARGPAVTGFAEPTLRQGLDQFFARLTFDNLQELLVQDLGHGERLDRFTSGGGGRGPSQLALATGPELLVHVTAGNLPNPALWSVVLGLLTRSAQFVKCATGSAWLPRLFAHSLYAIDHKLGACLEVAEWRGGRSDLEDVLFGEADCVTATGSEETVAAIRRRVPTGARLLSYGHRFSLGYVARDALSRYATPRIVAGAAADVVAWNQLGCLSPHLIYVEPGGALPPVRFAELLAEELARLEIIQPRGPLPVEMAGAIASRRAFYEIRAAHSDDTRLWCSPGSTAWTVVYEAEPLFQPSCLNRFVYVKPVNQVEEALGALDAVRGQVSSVGLAATGEHAQRLATQLARWGVTRICPLGQMQQPLLTWHHDGRPALGDLVTWTDWEQ